jgi:hypothetical protein
MEMSMGMDVLSLALRIAHAAARVVAEERMVVNPARKQ